MTDPLCEPILAPAKVNLTLHVTGQRSDGYHLLDSLVMFADIGDRITLFAGTNMSVDVTGPFASGVPADQRNLVWRAADSVGWTGRIHLEKNLPHAAGIGSGSSDAAAVLSALESLGNTAPPEVALALGADVPVCLQRRATRMSGIGERLNPIEMPSLPALLVNPGIPIPTSGVFTGLARRDNPPMAVDLPRFSDVPSVVEWLQHQRNDLEAPALNEEPRIAEALDALAGSRQALLARMSGSGATCFALYPDLKAAQFAAYEIEAAFPDWWCAATVLH